MTQNNQPSFKSDLRKAGVRIACRRTVSVVRDTLVMMLASGKSKSEAKKINQGISSLFDTEIGRGIIGYIMGACLPMVKEYFPEKFQAVTEELATEFRVEGMAVIGDGAITALLPMLGLAKNGIMEAMTGLVEQQQPSTTTNVRVDTGNAGVKLPVVEQQQEQSVVQENSLKSK